MTIKEFEKAVESIKYRERDIKDLKEFISNLQKNEAKHIPVVVYQEEDRDIEYSFYKDSILAMTEKELETLIKEYKDKIEAVKQAGLTIEPDLELIGE